jgi:hypothetical protein
MKSQGKTYGQGFEDSFMREQHGVEIVPKSIEIYKCHKKMMCCNHKYLKGYLKNRKMLLV